MATEMEKVTLAEWKPVLGDESEIDFFFSEVKMLFSSTILPKFRWVWHTIRARLKNSVSFSFYLPANDNVGFGHPFIHSEICVELFRHERDKMHFKWLFFCYKQWHCRCHFPFKWLLKNQQKGKKANVKHN